MLKYFYKTFLISILCGSLMMLDFSYKGIMLQSLRAESVKTEKIDDSDMMGTLTMTVVGVLASRLYKYKPTTDIMLAAAGGAAFLAGEVLAFIKLKDVMKGMEEQITRDKNGNINREQIAALERLKQSYVEAKKTANMKKMLQMAAAAAFAAAGVMAFTMDAGDTAALTACTTDIAKAQGISTAREVYCSTPYTAWCKPDAVACSASLKATSSAMTSQELARQATGPSAAAFSAATTADTSATAAIAASTAACALVPGAQTLACTTKIATNKVGESFSSALLSIDPTSAFNHLKNHNPIFKEMLEQKINNSKISFTNKFLNQTIELFFPKAEAALFSAMGIASSAAIAFIMYTYPGIASQIDFFMLIPRNRALIWAILAGLTFAATTATNNVISQIDANIAKIDAILNSLYSLADGTTATQTKPQVQNATPVAKPGLKLSLAAQNYEDIDLTNGVDGTLPCFTGPDPKNCKSFEDATKNLTSYQNLDSTSQAQLGGILKTASGFNGTSRISKGTLGSAANMAGTANALRVALEKSKANALERLKKSGSKLNLDDQSKKLSSAFDKAIRDGLKKSNSSASDMMASLYGGKAGFARTAESDAAAAAAAAELAEAQRRAAAGAGAGGVVDIGGDSSSEKMNLGLDGQPQPATPTAEELAMLNEANKAGATALDDYELGKNEISTDTSASLFDLISNRYQQSGYKRLFRIKEPQPPVKN